MNEKSAQYPTDLLIEDREKFGNPNKVNKYLETFQQIHPGRIHYQPPSIPDLISKGLSVPWDKQRKIAMKHSKIK